MARFAVMIALGCIGALIYGCAPGANTPKRLDHARDNSAVAEHLPPQIDPAIDGYTAVQLARDTTLYRTPSRALPRGTVDERSVFLRTRLWVPVLERDGAFERVPTPWVKGFTSAYIRSTGLPHRPNRYLVVVSTRRYHLWVLTNGKVVHDTPAQIGERSSPTPLGSFFVTDRTAVPPDQQHIYGTFALGISVLQEHLPRSWGGGNQVAIHGGDESIQPGERVTAGCVVIDHRSIEWMRTHIPLGTLVVIQR